MGGILKMSAGKSLEKSRLKIPKSYVERGGDGICTNFVAANS